MVGETFEIELTLTPSAIQIFMNGEEISELVHYTYENGKLTINYVKGNIEIRNVSGYCLANGINKLSDCMIATDINTSKEQIKKKTVDLTKIEPQIQYEATQSLGVEASNIASFSNAIYCTEEKPVFDTTLGKYILTSTKRVEIPACISTEEKKKYASSSLSSDQVYSIYEYVTSNDNNITTYKVMKADRYRSKISGETKSNPGIYMATDDFGESYFYRGSVTNNYVSFGGYIWRIIRVNGDGSIRMIYSGTSATDTGNKTSIGKSMFNSDGKNQAICRL